MPQRLRFYCRIRLLPESRYYKLLLLLYTDANKFMDRRNALSLFHRGE